MANVPRRPESEQGFTLIELMVTVLILGVLIAIALPTLVGARQRASDRVSHVQLKETLTSAKIHFTDDQSYTGFTDLVLESMEPGSSANMNPSPNVVVDEVSIRVAADAELLVVTRSQTGVVFCLAEDDSGSYRGEDPDDVFSDVSDCAAAPQTW